MGRKFLIMSIMWFLLFSCVGVFAGTRCELAKKNCEKAKTAFLSAVSRADALGSKYNDCMHQNSGASKACTKLKHQHQKARQERKKPRQDYYTAVAREGRECVQE